VKQLLDDALKVQMNAAVKLVKGSHIVVPRIHDKDHAYILQHSDKRVVFVIPFEEKFSLIGTTDVNVERISDAAEITADETDYLVHAVNRFLAKPINQSDVVWSYAGVRPLYDDGADNPSEITRDYVLKVAHEDGKLPLLSIFGGKITTYRHLAEEALNELKAYYPGMTASSTGTEALPGGDIDSLDDVAQTAMKTHPGLPVDYLLRLASRHGSLISQVLAGAGSMAELGEVFGAGATLLSEREIDYCIQQEWARMPDDILWRRTKCGLHMDAVERERAATFIRSRVAALVG
jgi:glycerol-3-phosphate dehydrogenase